MPGPEASPAAEASPPHRLARRELAALSAVLALAAGLRLPGLGAHGYSPDELSSLQTSAARSLLDEQLPGGVYLDPAPALTSLHGAPPLASVWTRLVNDNHPPLYFVALRLWRQALGDGERATRSLSLAASLAAILLLYDAARTLHGAAVALWAGLLMAVAAPQVAYAREARAYALLLAFGMGACAALARLKRHGAGARRALALGACTLGLLLSHYYGLGAAIGAGVYVLLGFRGAARRQALGGLAVAAALFLAAWLPYVAAQRGRVAANVWLQDPSPGHVGRSFERLAGLPLRHLADEGARPGGSQPWAVLLLAPAAVAMRRHHSLALWFCWLGGAALLITALDLAFGLRQLEVVRYTLIGAPALYVLLAGAAAEQPRIRHLLPAAALVIGVLALPRVYAARAQRWSDLGLLVRTAVGPREPLVLVGPQRRALLALSHYAGDAGRPLVLAEAPLAAAVLARLRQADAVWVVSDPDVPLERYLGGARVAERTSLGHLPSLSRVVWSRP